MPLWNYCAICGERIEVGEPCIGVEKNSELIGDSICLDCAKIENFPGGKEPVSITDLLARAEEAEARAEKAERERDAAVKDLERIKSCKACKHCDSLKTLIPIMCQKCHHGDKWEWRGPKEE